MNTGHTFLLPACGIGAVGTQSEGTMKRIRMAMWAAAFGLLGVGPPASAELPDAETMLENLGYDAEAIQKIKAGKIAAPR